MSLAGASGFPDTASRLAALCVVLLALLAGSARAQPAPVASLGTSFLTPFPENDTYRLVVIGDAFAEGILEGLRESFGPETRIDVPRSHRRLAGINRNEFPDETRWIDDPASKDVYHLAVVMLGTSDRRSLRTVAGTQVRVGTPEWLEAYGARVDQLAKALKKRRIPVYWVGLPVVRRADATDDHQAMNEVIREKVFLNGQKYVDVFNGFADESGSFDTYGPDLTGKMRKMRDNDGILFTWDGNKKLAHFVEREIKRDLAQARAERSIPLLGSEEEQVRLAPPKPKTATANGKPQPAASGPASPQRSFALQSTPPPAEPGAEQKADNSRISLRVVNAQGKEETVAIDLPRPAISANVMALVTRQQSDTKAAQLGDNLVDEIQGGVTVLSSITPVSISGRRSLSSSQAPQFRVLVKGERLNPKLGRVDDFSWPPPALVEPPPVAPVAPPPAPASARQPPPAEKKSGKQPGRS